MPLDKKTYEKIFVNSDAVKKEDFAKAWDESASSGRALDGVLVDLGILTNEEVGKIMAKAYGVKFINLSEITIPEDVIKILPDSVIRKQWAFAYGIEDEHLQVALVNPQNIELVDFLKKKTKMPVDIAYVTPGIFEDALRSYSQDAISRIQELSDNFERVHQEHKDKKLSEDKEGEEAHAIEIVDLILRYGYTNNASDVHIEPKEKFSLIRYRIDGVLHDAVKIPTAVGLLIISRIKIISSLRTDEHFTAQDGKFRMLIENRTVDVRVSILPVIEGEKVELRILSERGHSFTLDNLGFSKEDFKKVNAEIFKPYGMILSAGPTGSGKTTTMYAVLKLINSREVNIQTIEDPVEYELDGVNQIQVNPLTNLTFANGLRSIVRQDPDIIMVGEIRDAETANISVNAAMTGHLLLSTIHTNDAATTIPRLLDLQVEPFLIASSVKLIIAQRLVRHICKNCITHISVDISKYKESLPANLYNKYFAKRKTASLFHGKGCDRCSKTGFNGRVGIFEVLEMSEAIRDLVMKRANADIINQKALEEGTTSMLEDGIKKVISGVTTLEEVLSNVTS